MRYLYEVTLSDNPINNETVVVLNPGNKDQHKVTIKEGRWFLDWVSREALMRGVKELPEASSKEVIRF
jgi:hypothetical protein